jgi:hypothetical protein
MKIHPKESGQKSPNKIMLPSTILKGKYLHRHKYKIEVLGRADPRPS